MAQQIKRGWRMMLGIWFLLLGAVLPGCPDREPLSGVIVAPLDAPSVEPEKKSLPGEKSANSSAIGASEQVETVPVHPVEPIAPTEE